MEVIKAETMIQEGSYHPKFLIIGEGGGGKTSALTTFPPSLKVLVLDFFGNKESLEGAKNVEILSYSSLDPRKASAYLQLEKDKRQILSELNAGKFSYDVLCLDTITGLIRFIMEFVIKTNPDGRGVAGAPAMHHHMGASHLTGEYLTSFLGFPITVVLNAHAELVRDETAGTIQYQPIMSGARWRNTLSTYVGEVYRAFGVSDEKDSSKTKFLWQTQPDRRWPMLKSVLNKKSSLFGKFIDPNYEKLFELRGMIKKGGDDPKELKSE